MRESITYQEILEEGRAEGELTEARRILMRQGERRLGAATPAVETRIKAIDSRSVLEALLDRVLEVETWDDLLSILTA